MHPLLAQTPLSVNPYLELPKAPTLPHNYASLPSTLPPSVIDAPAAASDPELPAYVTSSSGFAAHPATIIKQNVALLQQFAERRADAHEKMAKWEQSIKDRELQERRRKAPGWLDSENKLLEPKRVGDNAQASLLDAPSEADAGQPLEPPNTEVDELGAAMDRVFGRSEMA